MHLLQLFNTQDKNQELQAQTNSVRAEVHALLCARDVSAQSLKAKVAQLEEELSAKAQVCKDLKRKAHTHDSLATTLQSVLQQLNGSLTHINNRVDQTHADMDVYRHKMENAIQHSDQLVKQIAVKDAQIAELQLKLKQLNTHMADLAAEKAALHSQHAESDKQLQDITNQLQQAREGQTDMQHKLDQLSGQLADTQMAALDHQQKSDELQANLDGKHEENAALQKAMDDLSTKHATAQAEVKELADKCRLLEQQLQSDKEHHQQHLQASLQLQPQPKEDHGQQPVGVENNSSHKDEQQTPTNNMVHMRDHPTEQQQQEQRQHIVEMSDRGDNEANCSASLDHLADSLQTHVMQTALPSTVLPALPAQDMVHRHGCQEPQPGDRVIKPSNQHSSSCAGRDAAECPGAQPKPDQQEVPSGSVNTLPVNKPIQLTPHGKSGKDVEKVASGGDDHAAGTDHMEADVAHVPICPDNDMKNIKEVLPAPDHHMPPPALAANARTPMPMTPETGAMTNMAISAIPAAIGGSVAAAVNGSVKRPLSAIESLRAVPGVQQESMHANQVGHSDSKRYKPHPAIFPQMGYHQPQSHPHQQQNQQTQRHGPAAAADAPTSKQTHVERFTTASLKHHSSPGQAAGAQAILQAATALEQGGMTTAGHDKGLPGTGGYAVANAVPTSEAMKPVQLVGAVGAKTAGQTGNTTMLTSKACNADKHSGGAIAVVTGAAALSHGGTANADGPTRGVIANRVPLFKTSRPAAAPPVSVLASIRQPDSDVPTGADDHHLFSRTSCVALNANRDDLGICNTAARAPSSSSQSVTSSVAEFMEGDGVRPNKLKTSSTSGSAGPMVATSAAHSLPHGKASTGTKGPETVSCVLKAADNTDNNGPSKTSQPAKLKAASTTSAMSMLFCAMAEGEDNSQPSDEEEDMSVAFAPAS